jgi:predicted lipoprotein with Yx(FWY)xxD motif
MTRLITPLLAGAILLATTALLVAGCGGSAKASGASTTSQGSTASGGYGGAYGSAAPTTSMPTTSGPATISVRMTPLGRILVDGKGMTLYLFEKDTGTTSMCNGSCASFWPPTTTDGSPKAGGEVKASKLGTTTRSDGSTQVTYNGHPLYYYEGDSAPGDTAGQGQNIFGALWYVVSPAGDEVVG